MNEYLDRVSPPLDLATTAIPPTATTILFVEDNEVIQSFCALALSEVGYQVNLAGDGQAGWEALQLRKYDLLITDNAMPRLTGLELVARLRAAGHTLPVILASGTVGMDDVMETDGPPFAAILNKPFTPDELVATVKKVLAAASSRDPHEERPAGTREKVSQDFEVLPTGIDA